MRVRHWAGWIVSGWLLLVGEGGASGRAKAIARTPEAVATINGARCAHRCASEFCHAGADGKMSESCLTRCFWVCGDDESATARDNSAAAPVAVPVPPPTAAHADVALATPAPPAAASTNARAIDSNNPYGR